MASDPVRVKRLFQEAIEQASPAERAAFLDREVGGDPDLRERLDAMLDAHDRPHEVLDRPLDPGPESPIDTDPDAKHEDSPYPPTQTHAQDETVSDGRGPGASPYSGVIAGRYQILEEIAEGGMGTVYLADQVHPVRRQVALKLVKAGMDSRTVLSRFDVERQALALMDHPNIAKVLDAGVTPDGRPFFVMELVKGIPLTAFCDQQRLSLSERLAIFQQICSAVQHAHQKGIIHRDLKPGNILVESHDGKPVPRVIDFGLAKATGGLQLSDQPVLSLFGAVVGTPLYMAPEQAEFNAVDIDTRADIYALGVILYELLTGSTPIRRETLQRAAITEMLRVVREVEPPVPSHRISTSDALPNIAANRHTEPSRLSRFVRGDLDWIVMKALSKERRRRYDSAIGLANDVERFMNHEPVTAGPPTAAYRLRKFVRRHRGRVVAACVVFVALVAGIIGTTLGLLKANRQEAIAVTKADEARTRLRQRDEANRVLLSVFRNLNPRGEEAGDEPLSARLGKRLVEASGRIEGDAVDDPVGVAKMQLAIGEALVELSENDKGAALLEKAHATLLRELGPDHDDTLDSLNGLGSAHRAAGRFGEARKLLEEVLARTEAIRGPDDRDTLTAMANLAIVYQDDGELKRALPMHEEALRRRRASMPADDPDVLESLDSLASAYVADSRAARAIPLYEQALEGRKAKLPPDHPDTLASMSNLAGAYRAMGQFDRAVPLMEKALERAKATLSLNHRSTLKAMNNLALLYAESGDSRKALPLFELAFELRTKQFGQDDLDTLQSMDSLGSCLLAEGELDRAVSLFEEALKGRRTMLPPKHPDTLATMSNLAGAYRATRRLDLAIPLMEKAYEDARSIHAPEHRHRLKVQSNLGQLYVDANAFKKARPLIEQAYELRRTHLGADDPDTLQSMDLLGTCLQADGELDRAVSLLEGALKGRRARLPSGKIDTIATMSNLAGAYRANGCLDQAIPLMEDALGLIKAHGGPDHPVTISITGNLAALYQSGGKLDRARELMRECVESTKRRDRGGPGHATALAELGGCLLEQRSWVEAEAVLRESLEISMKVAPDTPITFVTRSMLGEALLHQKKTTEARMLLKSGYEGLKKRSASLAPKARAQLGKAIDRLIALAEATGKADDAKMWREERAKLPPESITKPQPKTP